MRVQSFKNIQFDSLLNFQPPTEDPNNPKLSVVKFVDSRLLVQTPPLPFVGTTQDNLLKAFGLKKSSFARWLNELEERITYHANANTEPWFNAHDPELKSFVAITKHGKPAVKLTIDDDVKVYESDGAVRGTW